MKRGRRKGYALRVERSIVLLRGINLLGHNRIAMPELRELLAGAGFRDVRTYVQSGNVVLAGGGGPDAVARGCERLIAGRFGLEVEVVVRTRDELAEVVRRDPLGGVATDPKRYQVTFMAAEPGPEAVRRLEEADLAPERFVLAGREIYAWHPDGVGRSRLAARLTSQRLGVAATARNWTTVTNLLAMADE
jgi:uncharacterized protein (DUF1697 family)